MRRHHTGSGRRTVLPSDWETALAPVVEQFMLEATVNLRAPGSTTVFDEGLGRTVTTVLPPFAIGVVAKITPISASEVGVVEQQAWILGYRVLLPISTPTAQLDEGIMVDVVTCSDAMLVGKALRVTDVVRGTHLLQRELVTDLAS